MDCAFLPSPASLRPVGIFTFVGRNVGLSSSATPEVVIHPEFDDREEAMGLVV